MYKNKLSLIIIIIFLINLTGCDYNYKNFAYEFYTKYFGLVEEIYSKDYMISLELLKNNNKYQQQIQYLENLVKQNKNKIPRKKDIFYKEIYKNSNDLNWLLTVKDKKFHDLTYEERDRLNLIFLFMKVDLDDWKERNKFKWEKRAWW